MSNPIYFTLKGSPVRIEVKPGPPPEGRREPAIVGLGGVPASVVCDAAGAGVFQLSGTPQRVLAAFAPSGDTPPARSG